MTTRPDRSHCEDAATASGVTRRGFLALLAAVPASLPAQPGVRAQDAARLSAQAPGPRLGAFVPPHATARARRPHADGEPGGDVMNAV